MITSEQAERKRFALWYNTHWDVEMITGQDDIDAAWEIWKAALSEIPARPVGYVGLSVEGEPVKFRAGSFGSGHPVYMSPVAAAVPEAKIIIDRVVEELENGFVVCERCGDQEDTATLDCMTDLKRLKALLSTPTTPQADGWNWCSEKMPKIGQRVILEKNGVIQNYMPVLDMGDEQEGCFWDFEDAADSDPLVDMEFDRWMPLPNARQEGA